ncbi:nicotinate-nucleotide-dimethylbenzimidazole phosphoribosyltransferase-like protein [Blastocladiella britannica]|nr:nicotinate-nucleotide-dimethylbenzimidazole phosphoribosyltransferase-like protein [Blastocladiella britannica]
MTTISKSDAREHLLNKTKPPGSLGQLEAWAEKLILVQQTLHPRVDRTRVVLFAADNGLAHLSQYPKQVTREMLRNVAEGGAAINCLCRAHGIDLRVSDLGVDLPPDARYAAIDHFRLLDHGTATPTTTTTSSPSLPDMAAGQQRIPAMDPVAFSYALSHGRKALHAARADSVQVLGVGELGIGNSAVAAALLAAATHLPASRTTGAGTGVAGDRLTAKIDAVQGLVDAWRDLIPNVPLKATMPLDQQQVPDATIVDHRWAAVAQTLGDLEITAMATVVHEAARSSSSRILVVVDGFISQVALLYALLMYPADAVAMVTVSVISHCSAEAPGTLLLQTLRTAAVMRGVAEEDADAWTRPMGSWEMRLGEGSGAALVIPLLKSAAAVASDMATFAGAGVSTASS